VQGSGILGCAIFVQNLRQFSAQKLSRISVIKALEPRSDEVPMGWHALCEAFWSITLLRSFDTPEIDRTTVAGRKRSLLRGVPMRAGVRRPLE
jgi:hypothetical protein